MATQHFLVLTALAASAGASAIFGRKSQAFLESAMQPEIVARTLSRVEDEWKAQAAVFAECSSTVGLPGASIVNCNDAPTSFGKSCSTVVSAIIQGSGGDKDVTKEYMDDVCSQHEISGWHQKQCHTLAIAVRGAMSADKYQNRMSFNTEKLCTGFWSSFLHAEQERTAKENAEREAAEKKAADEVAEKERVHLEDLKKQEERKKVEEAERKKHEVAAEAAEAKAKAAEAAAKVAEKKAEAKVSAEAAKQKMVEAEAAALEHKNAVAKSEAAAAKTPTKSEAKPEAVAAAKPVASAPVADKKVAPAPVADKKVTVAAASKVPVATKAATQVAAKPAAAQTAAVKK